MIETGSVARGLAGAARVAVFAPSVLLTITVEQREEWPDIHLHAGGQGFWVARMATELGAEVVLCTALGGESGRVLHGLIESENMSLRPALVQHANGIYIHDRRSGERVEVAAALARPLRRHELDELFGITLTSGLTADIVLLTGPFPEDAVEASLYTRLTRDLRRNGKRVIADLTGPALAATLAAGVDLLKLSHEEALKQGVIADDGFEDLLAGMRELQRAGAASVLISRGPSPALFLTQVGEKTSLMEVRAPQFEELDHTGAGDSMFAALGVALAGGLEISEALCLAAAAGALNVTRHGLGSGTRREIERLAQLVVVEEPVAAE